MENEAELVADCHRRQDDPAAGTAVHVQTCRLNRRRGQGQSCGLRVEARSCGVA